MSADLRKMDPGILAQLPRTAKLFYEVEQAAQAEYARIMADIATGKTTLEEERRKRGIF